MLSMESSSSASLDVMACSEALQADFPSDPEHAYEVGVRRLMDRLGVSDEQVNIYDWMDGERSTNGVDALSDSQKNSQRTSPDSLSEASASLEPVAQRIEVPGGGAENGAVLTPWDILAQDASEDEFCPF